MGFSNLKWVEEERGGGVCMLGEEGKRGRVMSGRSEKDGYLLVGPQDQVLLTSTDGVDGGWRTALMADLQTLNREEEEGK